MPKFSKTVNTVGGTGFLYVSLGNLESNVQMVKKGTAAPVVLHHKAIPQSAPEQQT